MNEAMPSRLLLLIILLHLCQSVTIGAPGPMAAYDLDYLQIGGVKFTPTSNNILTNGGYASLNTITFTKMDKHLPNNFAAFLGWRGIDITLKTLTQGPLSYSLLIVSRTSTGITIRCFMDQVSTFIMLSGNYMLVHEIIVKRRLIYGAQIRSTVSCTGGDPVDYSVPSCKYFASLSTPQVLPNSYISVIALKMARGNNPAHSNLIRIFLIRHDNNTVRLDMYYGRGGVLSEFSADILFFDHALTTRMAFFQLQQWEMSPPATTAPFLEVYRTFTNNVFDFNYFVMFRYASYWNLNLQFQASIQTNKTIKNTINYQGSLIAFKSFIFYSYRCPDYYYYSNTNIVCEICPKSCLKCALRTFTDIYCLECPQNFQQSSDQLSCECNIALVSGVCDDFNALGFGSCTHAQRTSTGVQCRFCNQKNFQAPFNNQCLCKSGYSDFDNDGICTETCGDGIIFDADCDDGNTKSNDGCSSTCTKEAGFLCDENQPNFCKSDIPLAYKFGFVEKIQDENKGKITLALMNTLSSLPFDFNTEDFKPSQSHVKLFIIQSQLPFKEIEIVEAELQELAIDKDIILEFPYSFTVEKLRARIEIDYSQTRYMSYVQNLGFHLNSLTSPLVYSQNMATFTTISIVLCVGTGLSLLGLVIGLCSPKYIGLESLLTLQLVFFSQLLIVNPSKWPAGFMYLKYLKFASGFNEVFKLSDFIPSSASAKKLYHLDMKKTIIENFNLNFVILGLSFLVFIFVCYLKYFKQTVVLELHRVHEEKMKEMNLKQANESLKETHEEIKQRMNQIKFFEWASEKIFWIVNHLSVWMILPLMSSLAAHLMIGNNLVEQLAASDSLSSQIIILSPIIAVSSSFIITFICMNNFKNTFLSQETLNKILLKPEEKTYKSCLVLYLCVFGFLILFFNEVVVYKIPMSMFVFVLQVLYTIILVVVHPYRQSLRVHTVTLLINQVVYTVFLAFINLINMVEEIDEILVIMLGYFITGCCGFLMLLTGVRLYYELRYGEALEKKIQKEREQEEERQKKLKEERLEMMKKKLESDAKKKQSQKEIERGKNPFLYENQVNEDQAKDVIEWLQKCNWEAETKQKYFFQKFTKKPLDWLKKNDKAEYEKVFEMRRNDKQSQKKQLSAKEAQDIIKLKEKLKKTALLNGQIVRRAQNEHKKKMRTDMNYTMDVMREGLTKFVGYGYKLAN